MGIVRFALRLPHTFYVLAVLVVFLGATAMVSIFILHSEVSPDSEATKTIFPLRLP